MDKNPPIANSLFFDEEHKVIHEEEMSTSSEDPANVIQNVWAYNFEEEMKKVKMLLATGRYTYIALDTEFPGVVCRPARKSTSEEYFSSPTGVYDQCKANCNLMKPIQMGFSLFDEKGNRPPGISTWQLNLKFDLSKDVYSPRSIELLKRSGVEFERLAVDGIDLKNLPKILVIARIAMNPRVTWIVFHGNYDLSYMLRIMNLMQPLPNSLLKFTAALKTWFPNIYDVRVMMCRFSMKGGLQRTANLLKIQRIGNGHQAGSDALLTGDVFFKFRKQFNYGKIDHIKLNGRLYGFDMNYAELQNYTYTLSQVPGVMFSFDGLGKSSSPKL